MPSNTSFHDKRSIDAYGRSIELAIAGYLMDTGDFPTSIEQLTIEYSGDEVVCSTTQLNSDSSIYLAGCTVGGRSVDGYTYGYTYGKGGTTPTNVAYEVGDEVTYNNIDYYVIKDSSSSEDSVTLLKAEPLSVAEVNQYGNGHVNRYTYSSLGTAYDVNGYGGMAYYTSETCGFVNRTFVSDGCKNDYASSEIKYVVDAWKAAKAPAATEARLITYDELEDNFELEEYKPCGDECGVVHDKITADWMYNSSFWTMSQHNDSTSDVWDVSDNGMLGPNGVHNNGVVRPVITIKKSAL